MKNLLVIRPGAIGDTLLTFPVLKALRESCKATCMTLVGNSQVLPLAIASGIVEQAFDFQDIRWSELFSSQGIRTTSLRDLLAQTDLAICWMRDPGGLVEHNLNISGVKQVIIAPGRPPDGEHLHIVDYLAKSIGLSALSPLFLSTPVEARVDKVRLGGPLWSPAAASVNESSPDTQTTTSKPFIAIHPGSGAADKCWPISRFAEIIKCLWKQNQPILLLAGPADTGRVDDLLKLLSPSPAPEMFKMLASAPLLEVAQYMQQCRCYLGNDSGITHLAAMLGVPTVAIFGPTDPCIWRPIGPTVKVIQKQTLEDVTVDDVIEYLSV